MQLLGENRLASEEGLCSMEYGVNEYFITITHLFADIGQPPSLISRRLRLPASLTL